MKCSICGGPIIPLKVKGKIIWSKGNNAEPINSGRCCDVCNFTVVFPARLANISKQTVFKKEGEKNEHKV